MIELLVIVGIVAAVIAFGAWQDSPAVRFGKASPGTCDNCRAVGLVRATHNYKHECDRCLVRMDWMC